MTVTTTTKAERASMAYHLSSHAPDATTFDRFRIRIMVPKGLQEGEILEIDPRKVFYVPRVNAWAYELHAESEPDHPQTCFYCGRGWDPA